MIYSTVNKIILNVLKKKIILNFTMLYIPTMLEFLFTKSHIILFDKLYLITNNKINKRLSLNNKVNTI